MKHYALIPAAGTGSRIVAVRPKQYLALNVRPMLYYSVKQLCANPRIARVYLVLAAGDSWFAQHDWKAFSEKLKLLRCGGETRAASVLNGLTAMQNEVAAEEWVLVHDAARPCLSNALLNKLLDEVGQDDVGGLLALPVADTLKRADGASRVLRTEPRNGLWQAQTPQMFRHALLAKALKAMQNADVTDEARAIEGLGLQPKLVVSDARNLKVTYPQDVELAQMILSQLEKP